MSEDVLKDPQDTGSDAANVSADGQPGGTLDLFAELSKHEYDSVLRNDIPVPARLRADEQDTASLASDFVFENAKDAKRRERALMNEAAAERELAAEDMKDLERRHRESRREAGIRNARAENEASEREAADRRANRAEASRKRKDRRRRIEYGRQLRQKELAAQKRKSQLERQRKRDTDAGLKAGARTERQHRKEQKALERARKDAENGRRPSSGRGIWGFVIYLLVVAGLAFLIVTFVMQKTVVSGNSMFPTLENGNHLMIEKVSYYMGGPERFDIIVFRIPGEGKTYYIKRVIGLPGETVQITDGVIYINGEILEEDYGNEVMQYSGLASEPLTLGDDEYFVLGDNRNDSTDSRFASVGPVNSDQILGHAFLRVWPFSELTWLA